MAYGADAIYRDFSAWERRTRQESAQAFPDTIKCIQRGIALASSLYHPFAFFNHRAPGNDLPSAVATFSHQYRVNLTAVALRTAKTALDLITLGYYHQSHALHRLVYETFRRLLFVRRRPETVFRFYPDYMIPADIEALEGYRRRSKPEVTGDEWRRLLEALPSLEDGDLDTRLIEVSYAQFTDLHAHAHPDYEGLADLMEVDGDNLRPDRFDLMPRFDRGQLRTALMVSGEGVAFLLYEAALWPNQDEEWITSYVAWLGEWQEFRHAGTKAP